MERAAVHVFASSLRGYVLLPQMTGGEAPVRFIVVEASQVVIAKDAGVDIPSFFRSADDKNIASTTRRGVPFRQFISLGSYENSGFSRR